MTTSGITARGIEMRFRTRDADTLVLDNLDIDIPASGFVTLLGPSGCGKSTLLKILGGILQPTSGQVTIGTRTAADAVKAREIGLVLQRPALLPWKSARANAAMLREIIGDRRGGQARSAADRALELVGLTHAASLIPDQLSGGMAQRVSIARALAMDPAILLMDEPFGALDAITRDEMNAKLADIWARTGKTVVFVTHSITEAIFLSDVVHVMATDPGRVVETIEIALPRPRTAEIFAEPRFADYTARLRQLLEPGVRQEG